MRRIVGAAIVLSLLSAHLRAQQLAISQVSFANSADKASMVQIDQQKYKLKIISSARLLSAYGPTDPTLEKLAPLLASQLSGKDFVLTSGGLNHRDPLDPAGLLVADGASLGPLAFSKGRRNEVAGVLCISEQGKASVLGIQEYQDKRSSCFGAIQAGPIVLLDRNPTLASLPAASQDSALSARLVACESKELEDNFIFYYFQPTTIARVEQSLRTKCKSAINLAGSNQAGISIWRQGKIETVGKFDTLLPSTIEAAPR